MRGNPSGGPISRPTKKEASYSVTWFWQTGGLLDVNLIKMHVDVYRTHTPMISLETIAEEFSCNNPKEELALITDGPAVSQRSKIRALNIEKYVGASIVTDDLYPDYSKPNPGACKRIQGSSPCSDCVYIADNVLKDFIAPAILGGLPSIRVRRADSLYYDVPTPDVCIEAASLNDVAELASLQRPCGSDMRGALSS